MVGNPQGSGVLANELLGGLVARECGLPVAESGTIYLSDAFIDKNPEIWFEGSEGSSRPQSGIHFKSSFVGWPSGIERPIEYISPSHVGNISNRDAFLAMYIFDVWANHLDHRQALLTRETDSQQRRAVFIDNGHLFGGPQWTTRYRPGVALHMERTVYADLWRKPEVEERISHFRTEIPAALHKGVLGLPNEWCPGDIGRLTEWLIDRLNCLEELVYADADRSGLVFCDGRVIDPSRLSDSGMRFVSNAN
jgi:hypothetical protein